MGTDGLPGPGDAAARQSVQERVFAGLLFVVLLGESAFVKKTQTPCYYKSFEVLNHCAIELGAASHIHWDGGIALGSFYPQNVS